MLEFNSLVEARFRQKRSAFILNSGLSEVFERRCSRLLLNKLFFLAEAVTFMDPILREFRHLEGLGQQSATKEGKQLSGGVLGGLWCKHVFMFEKGVIEHNLAKFSRLNSESIERIYLEHYPDGELWERTCGPEELKEETLPFLNALVSEAMNSQMGGLTGHWLLYSERDGQNYYLDLVRHPRRESGGLDDDNIARNLKGCLRQFPWLRYGHRDKN